MFGSYPSAIAAAFVELVRSGQLGAALYESLRPFVVGYGLAIVVGVPLGLVIGRFRVVEAALGIYVTAGYAMPLVALVPLLILWLGLGFAVKAAVVFLMSLFPISINTWLGVTAVPKSLIDVGRAFVAPDTVILRRIVLPATLPYIMAGIRLAVGRAVVAMVIAEFFTTISGLGAIIINSANNFDTATMFVPIVVLMVLAIGLNGADRLGRAPRRAMAGRNRRAGRIGRAGPGPANLRYSEDKRTTIRGREERVETGSIRLCEGALARRRDRACSARTRARRSCWRAGRA